MQEKFVKHISHFDEVLQASCRITDSTKLLNLPIIVTEHYSKGLGFTVPELRKRVEGAKIVEKTQFSMCTTDLFEHIKKTVPGSFKKMVQKL